VSADRDALRDTVREARRAGAALAALDPDGRAGLLGDLAAALEDERTRARILEANAADLARARSGSGAVAPALLDRLVLDGKKLDSVTDGLRRLTALPEVVGRVSLRRELDDGLILTRVACPLGVLAVVFEARPDALPQIAGLAWKSGNALVLKGGREARESHRALTAAAHQVLARHGLDVRALVLLEDRAEVDALLALDDLVDLVVARGGASFVAQVKSQTRIPVMGHAAGVCHVYLHRGADAAMAARIAVDAKCSYPAACNAAETLLWDDGAELAADAAIAALRARGVELRADQATRDRHPDLAAARDGDWDVEHGALVMSVRRVRGMDDALAHIAAHGSRHTEAIVTSDRAAAEHFLAAVDAASVFHNASTRFADGYRFGLGAEVGISTDKLHARGPVGVEGLLTYRWLLRGEGQVSASYGPGGRPFTHQDL